MSENSTTRLPASLRAVRSWHRPLVVFAAANALLIVVAIVGLLADSRELGGAPIWLKPLKFAVSFVLYGFALAWMISLMQRRPRWGYWLGVLVTVTGVIEMAIIVGQVIRGRQSHFNVETPLDSTLWSVMAGSIVLLWLATLAVAILLLRERIADRVLAAGIRLGLGVALIGMAIGIFMGVPNTEQQDALASGEGNRSGSHSVGVEDGGPGMPLTGWSSTGGDLRVGHFVGLHAAQGLPLLALVLGAAASRRSLLRDGRIRLRLVVVGAATWLGLTLLLAWQALRGQPLLDPDGLTLTVLAALLLGAAVAVATVQRTGREPAVTAP
ncbi:MAG: hypothetical protein M3R66_19635 [Actinomycetota bacterium]|nr:hypothetical protein [Actinomycetota bacterium]